MFYPVTAIDELMPDALVHTVEASNQVTYKNKMGYFLKSRPKIVNTDIAISNTFINSGTGNVLGTNKLIDTYEGSHGTLPECVLCHPSIGYSFRYGNVMLNGLDNTIDFETVNNGSWRP